MKTLYTILFFLGTIALIVITYLFLKIFDTGTGKLTFIAVLGGMIACIILLVFIMVRFISLSGSKKHR